MRRLSRSGRWAVGLLAAGLVLRLLLIWFPRSLDDDTAVYAELGQNLLRHGVYGLVDDGVVHASLIRLPGYPLTIALLGGHGVLVLLLQAALDLLGCWLLAATAKRWVGERAGMATLALGCGCVFTAAYAATELTESLSAFAVSLSVYGFGRLVEAGFRGVGVWWMGVACALAMLLRPDGALLLVASLVAVGWVGARVVGVKAAVRTMAAVGLLAVVPLAPWTVRNWRTFHVVQPLAPRHVNNPGERVNYGVYRWIRTWSVEFVSTGNVFWNIGSAPLNIDDLPSRAFDSVEQREKTEALFAEYNVRNDLTPELDAQFAALAEERVRANPLRYYVWVPAMRIADMWLRPRTETFDLDADWWHWRLHKRESEAAAGLGLLNLGYVVAAIAGMVAWRRARWMVLPVGYLALRCLLVGTLENPEARYTIEGYPMAILLAGCGVGNWLKAVLPDGPTARGAEPV